MEPLNDFDNNVYKYYDLGNLGRYIDFCVHFDGKPEEACENCACRDRCESQCLSEDYKNIKFPRVIKKIRAADYISTSSTASYFKYNDLFDF